MNSTIIPKKKICSNKDGSLRDVKFTHKLMSVKEILTLPQFNIIENESKKQTIPFKKSGKK